ncbi:RRP1B [Symbiodinium natans]|uniref:RRP1B protein n=1 Tax=Symbiodinium natans TaxID=878477 RepID=A0A812S0U8_9DINO|nr:RRP1B [Symbiodinium natans]
MAKEQGLPINFGKFLAHTDKVVRDRGFKRLKRWLLKHPQLERLEYMKVWKGLYFAVWMADKRPVQQELAVNIALLLNDVPREKRTLWIDTFWETMRDSWEKLDVHRVNKYLLLLRIVLAEIFKDLRMNGWQMQEVKDRAEVLLRPAPHRTNSASSVGIIMQLTRVLWDELQPQLEQSPKAAPQVILALLEPFIGLAEGSYVEGLVRSVHENVLGRVPDELLKQLGQRLLEAAANGAATQKNREALYDMVEVLENRIRCSNSTAPRLLLPDEASSQITPDDKGSNHVQKHRKKKRKKVHTSADSQERVSVSPLMLPKAALPLRSKVIAQRKKRQRLDTKEAKDVGTTNSKKTNCPGCGNAYLDDSLFCRKCGRKRDEVRQQHDGGSNVVEQPEKEEIRRRKKKKKMRKVSFDLLKNQVVTFSDKLPVSNVKEAAAKKVQKRR